MYVGRYLTIFYTKKKRKEKKEKSVVVLPAISHDDARFVCMHLPPRSPRPPPTTAQK